MKKVKWQTLLMGLLVCNNLIQVIAGIYCIINSNLFVGCFCVLFGIAWIILVVWWWNKETHLNDN